MTPPKPEISNGDRRSPKAGKAYGFLWVFVVVCVIFAAIVLLLKG
jgi:hypothetical protein